MDSSRQPNTSKNSSSPPKTIHIRTLGSRGRSGGSNSNTTGWTSIPGIKFSGNSSSSKK